MSTELKDKVRILQGHATYALGHLDDSIEHGYNDKIAINKAVSAIDMMINDFNEFDCINREELKAWKDELIHAGKEDAYTAAIAKALIDIAYDINAAIKESDEN